MHFVDGFVKVSLENLDVVLLCSQVTFGWKSCHFLFAEIVLYLPLLIFTELMQYLDQCLLGVRKVLDFTDLSKNPSFFVVFTVNKTVDFGIFQRKELAGRVMAGNELVEIDIKFEGIN